MQSAVRQDIETVQTISECGPQEKVRRELMHALRYSGERPVAELVEMSDAERCKWLFWNLHENLEEIRAMEPTLSALSLIHI